MVLLRYHLCRRATKFGLGVFMFVFAVIFVNNSPQQWSVSYSQRSEAAQNSSKIRNVVSNTEMIKVVKDCSYCYPHNTSIIHDNVEICSIANQIDMGVEVIILIASSHERFRYRDALRETWLAYSKHNTGRIRYAFLLGSSDQGGNIDNEVLKYRDIIQGSFKESQINTTQKFTMGLTWTVNNCVGARYIMRVNDDVYLNIPGLLLLVKNKGPAKLSQTSVGGFCQTKQLNLKSCSNAAYIMGMNVARNIHMHLGSLAYISSEELLLAKGVKKLGYSISHQTGIKINARMNEKNVCEFVKRNMVAATGLSSEHIVKIWDTECVDENDDLS